MSSINWILNVFIIFWSTLLYTVPGPDCIESPLMRSSSDICAVNFYYNISLQPYHLQNERLFIIRTEELQISFLINSALTYPATADVSRAATKEKN